MSKTQLTQFGRAMKHLRIQMIAAYSPEARGAKQTGLPNPPSRLPKKLALHGITDMDAANRYLAQEYKPSFNADFMQPPTEEGSVFVPWIGENLDDILCQ